MTMLVQLMSINLIQDDRSKHIAVHYHFGHERVVGGDLITQYIHSSLQVADTFSKGL